MAAGSDLSSAQQASYMEIYYQHLKYYILDENQNISFNLQSSLSDMNGILMLFGYILLACCFYMLNFKNTNVDKCDIM